MERVSPNPVMEMPMLIGLLMLIVFLVAVIIAIWKDTRKEKRFWDERNKQR